MEILIGKDGRFKAKVSRCIDCSENDDTCKISRFIKSSESIVSATDLTNLAKAAELRQGLRYGNVTSEGTEAHVVFLCDKITYDLETARINVVTSVTKR